MGGLHLGIFCLKADGAITGVGGGAYRRESTVYILPVAL